jgi:glycosyltransferase involved in cell wall biosynthesis
LSRLALVITTHERPDALAAVLDSVAKQVTAPDEIIIADDGSSAPSRAVIDDFTRRSTTPVITVHQEHRGFRVARLRNLAIAATSADYLVFIDGDMLLHPGFIADHRRVARPGRFTQGVRVLADAELTRRLLAWPPVATPAPFSRGLGGLRRLYLLRSRVLSAVMRRAANGLIAIKSCNLAAWRADLVRVNGFDEDFEGWGPEDKELAQRLRHAGVRRQTLLFGGIATHLHHPAASRNALPANLARLERTRRERRIRCDHGLDSHGP